MAQGSVLTYATHPRWERLQEEQVAEQLPRVSANAVDRGPLVAAVEVAKEVAPVAPVEGEERGRLPEGAGREPGPLGAVHGRRGEPGERLHHVGGDERVLEVEGGHMPAGRQDRPQ